MGFPGSSAGKEFACNAGDLGSIHGLDRSLENGTAPTPVFRPGEYHGAYSPWGRKESDTTATLTLMGPHKNMLDVCHMPSLL